MSGAMRTVGARGGILERARIQGVPEVRQAGARRGDLPAAVRHSSGPGTGAQVFAAQRREAGQMSEMAGAMDQRKFSIRALSARLYQWILCDDQQVCGKEIATHPGGLIVMVTVRWGCPRAIGPDAIQA